MNVFCCPGVFDDGRVFSLLGLEAGAVPEFGFKARVPLLGGKFDRTEVDMRLGSLLVEAKLTESDFQTREKAMVESYRDFAEVFDRKALPKTKDRYLSYQLIRNVLAAQANDCAFCVLCDARRPDLLQAWYEIMRCGASGGAAAALQGPDLAGAGGSAAARLRALSRREVRDCAIYGFNP